MTRVNFDDVDSTDSLEYMVDGVLFTGEVVEFAPSGELVELVTVVNGLPHGPSLSWYRNGQLRLEQSVVRSRAVGRSRRWYPDGTLADELMFDDYGALTSKTVWNERGEEIERTTYGASTNSENARPGEGTK